MIHGVTEKYWQALLTAPFGGMLTFFPVLVVGAFVGDALLGTELLTEPSWLAYDAMALWAGLFAGGAGGEHAARRLEGRPGLTAWHDRFTAAAALSVAALAVAAVLDAVLGLSAAVAQVARVLGPRWGR